MLLCNVVLQLSNVGMLCIVMLNTTGPVQCCVMLLHGVVLCNSAVFYMAMLCTDVVGPAL